MLLDFDPLSEEDVQILILGLCEKILLARPNAYLSYAEMSDILLPVITSLINLSLETGQFPDVWKEAIGYPLLKMLTVEQPLQIFVLLVTYLISLNLPRRLSFNN